jgi:nucleoside-diphosphate-sugar epimerase
MLRVSGSTGTIGRHLPSSAKSISVDISNSQEIEKTLFFGISDNFLHLAGVVGDGQVKKDLNYSSRVNVTGTILLAKKFLAESSGVFYFVSTSHVYEKSLRKIDEHALIQPATAYARQKFEAELRLREIFEDSPGRLCIIRLFSILDWDVPEFTLGGAVRKIAEDREGFFLQNCDDIRDFLTPSKVAQVLHLIASEGKMSGITNLCSGQEISVGFAARQMLLCSGFDVPSEKFVAGESSNPYLVGDNRRLRSFYPSLDLTWNPSRMN